MDTAEIQKQIFEQVKSQITHKRWIDEIAKVLGRSKNSIYKKLTGEIGLSLDELAILSKEYNIFLDPIVQKNKVVSFAFPFLEQKDKVIQNYFQTLQNLAIQFEKMPGLKIWMSQMEIPLFHDYNFPEITAFKFFIHEKTIWRSDRRLVSKFNLEKAINQTGFKEISNQLLKTYYQIPSVEFWHSLILDITLAQIKYTMEIGAFEDPLDAMVLCEKLIDFVNHTQYMADLGLKIPINKSEEFKSAEFVLYHNEVAHSDNIIMLDSSINQTVFLSFGNPHFLFSSSESVVNYSKRWFDVLKENSQLITRESRKSRLAFFNELRKKIDQMMLELNTLRKLQKL
jgi:hypothetical protein